MAECLLSKSNYWKLACLNAALRGETFTAPETVYVALYTSDPTQADTGQEVDGGGYARVAITFSDPVISGLVAVTSNSTELEFPIAANGWGQVTHIGIRDAATGGNLLYHGSVATPRTIEPNDRVKFLEGALEIEEG
ncbi:phage tail fiber protein [Paenibacillus senegalensis]|uniref:phage tail fiber protein n=1 Tax=Paenibacillus senegalensis TaxID=1465766 RepID=UPI000289C1E2|nr:hypothetical protein [Paenibacillus senegalensis]